MRTLIIIGRERSGLPDITGITGPIRAEIANADLVITMNRPCTQAAVVKDRNGRSGMATVIYQSESA